MTSSIGQGAYGKPTKLAVPRSILSGSTSGIGGQSTESCARYDSTYLFNYLYVPGSKRFLMPSRQNYDGPKGNWGQRLITKVNLRKQVSGASGYLRDPSKRMKNHEFKSINFGLVEKVNPQLPRGGNVPQVVGSSNTADPRSFYSDYNWGNPNPQKHDVPEGGYYTFPPDGKEETAAPVDPNAETNYTSASAALNPMSGTSGLGALAKRASTNEIVDEYMKSMDQAPQLVNEQIENTLGNQDFAIRRASRLTGAFDSARIQQTRSAMGAAQNMIQNMPPPSKPIKDTTMKDAKPKKIKKAKSIKDAPMKDAKPEKSKKIKKAKSIKDAKPEKPKMMKKTPSIKDAPMNEVKPSTKRKASTTMELERTKTRILNDELNPKRKGKRKRSLSTSAMDVA